MSVDGSSPGAGPSPESGLPPACVPDEGGRCSICGDEGRIAEVLETPGDDATGRVRMLDGETGRTGHGPVETVALDLVGPVGPGDRVIVHMGFAIARLRGDGEESPEAGT